MSTVMMFEAIPQRTHSPLLPFFHVEIPILAPGINQSYAPAQDEHGKLIMVHTEVAKQFIHDMQWLLRSQQNIKIFDARVFDAISHSREKVPLDVTIREHLRTLWQRDVDGPVKIILDALFAHFKYLADTGCDANWNDNRITGLHAYKDISFLGQPSIEIECRCVVSGK